MEGRGGALLCCAWVVYGDAIAVAAGGEDETIALVSFDRGPEGRQGKLGGQVAFLDGHTSFVTDVQCAGELKSSRERKGEWCPHRCPRTVDASSAADRGTCFRGMHPRELLYGHAADHVGSLSWPWPR